jgi:LPXTG-site transpeptidase (sortase) family protein
VTTGKSDAVTLTAGETDNSIDAGMFQTAALGDFVWNDTNNNGLQDAGEPGIPGVTVTLYDSTGTTVIGTPTTTDANGYYHFTNLAPGNYVVGFTLPSGYSFTTQYSTALGHTTANDSNASVTTGKSDAVTLTAGETDNSIDAGLIGNLSLGDFVWNDLNGDGLQTSGEPGVPGVTVQLLASDATTVLATTTTDTTGHYIFNNLIPGTYYVHFAAPTGATFTTKYSTATGYTTANDSNPNPGTGTTDAINLTATDLTIDAGLIGNASLGNYVWDDTNANGLQDTGEAGIPGVTVKLYDSTGKNVLETTTTNASGLYQFTNLLPGTYYVGFTLLGGYQFSPQYSTAVGHTTENDSNANTTTGMSDAVTLTVGETDNSIDAGMWQPKANLFDPPIGIKVLSATSLPELEWQMTWINNANAAAINVQITDPIPAGTTYVPSSLTCNPNGASVTTKCNYDSVLNQIFWQGSIAPDMGVTDPTKSLNKVVITFRVTVLGGVNSVNNQGSSITDTTGGGTFTSTPASISRTNIASWPAGGGGTNGGGAGANGINGINPASVLPSTGFAPGVITSIAPKPANVYDTSSDLTIEIPALGINTAIVGVPQSGNTWDITWLGDQVGYLDGTAFPTLSGNSVITGHVYEANGLPGPFVNLHTLKWGDQVIIHFAGQRYIYEVRENDIVSPSNTSAFKHEDLPWLTLVTCKDYNATANTYAHRVVVSAALIQVLPDASSNPNKK